MAQFTTFDFIYDGVPSQKFDLKIISFDNTSPFTGVGSSDINILEQRVLRKSKPYYLGRTQETKLEFPLTFGTSRIISGMERDLISAWLFGRSIYKKLYIVQDDLNGAYFNCFFTKPQPLYMGNLNYAFTVNVTCDSPWAYSPERVFSSGSIATGWGSDTTPYTFGVYNASSEDEYLYPTIDFTISQGVGLTTFLLTNVTDSGRMFLFNNLEAGEIISVNNDLQMIDSTLLVTGGSDYSYITYPKRLSNFNKNWFRLLPKYNLLNLNANIDSFEIKWTERMKIGG